MKKLCRRGTVYPSPAIKPDEQFLSLLPVAILSLVAALSVEDREVLAYLVSNSSVDLNRISRLKKNKTHKANKDHLHYSPLFFCDCFSCYTSYWVRWDSSPNRQVIHQIIDAVEENLEMKKNKKKKDRRKRSGKGSIRVDSGGTSRLSELDSSLTEMVGSDSVKKAYCGGEETEKEKGSLGKIVSLIGQKVFGVWG